MKYILLISIGASIFFSCREKSNVIIPILKNSSGAIEFIRKQVKDTELLIYSDDAVRVYGTDTSANKYINIEVKFEPFIGFSDFAVKEVYAGKKSSINYRSNPIARMYRTIITDTYKNSPATFAGHYCLAEWRCGMPCQGFAIVDLIDGKVYEGVDAQSGYEYKRNSRMIIVNPPDSSGFYELTSFHGHPEIWIWDEKAKRFVERKPNE